MNRFYRLSDGEIAALRDHLTNLQPAETPFSAAYPHLLTEAEVAANHPTGPHLVAVRSFDDGLAAVFASTRAVEIREPLQLGELPDEAADALSDYAEIIGVRHVKSQAMDIVWVPREGNVVDVRIDSPKGMAQDAGVFAHEQMRAVLYGLVGVDYLHDNINLFTLIERMYLASTEGVVVELAFGTSTASLKHERMRRRSICLRTEAYHMGGKAALTVPIDPYKLSIQWTRNHGAINSRPEMSLSGTHRMATGPNGQITEVAIRRCVGTEDFEFVRSRIVHFLNSIEDDALKPQAQNDDS